jgi:hypothetical protein
LCVKTRENLEFLKNLIVTCNIVFFFFFLIFYLFIFFLCFTLLFLTKTYYLVYVKSDFCDLADLENVSYDLTTQAAIFAGISESWIDRKVSVLNTTSDPDYPEFEVNNCTIILDLSGSFPARYI